MIESQGDKFKAIGIAVLLVGGGIYWAFQNGLFDFGKEEVVSAPVVIPPPVEAPVTSSLFDLGSNLSSGEKELIYKLGQLKGRNDDLEAAIVEDKIESLTHASSLRQLELKERQAALAQVGQTPDALPMGIGIVRNTTSSDAATDVRLVGITNDGIALVSRGESIHQLRPGQSSGELSLMSLNTKAKLAVVDVAGRSISLSMNSISSRSRPEITENYTPPSENSDFSDDVDSGLDELDINNL